jgi:hypothetical protein
VSTEGDRVELDVLERPSGVRVVGVASRVDDAVERDELGDTHLSRGNLLGGVTTEVGATGKDATARPVDLVPLAQAATAMPQVTAVRVGRRPTRPAR